MCNTAGYECECRDAALNGDEVRRLVLPTAHLGYDSAAVDELLDQVATELDAGRPVAPLIEATTFPPQELTFWQGVKGPYPHFLTGDGYDWHDVDGVLSQLRREDDPAALTDPWRDLPAWRYGTGRPDAGGASPTPRAAQKEAVLDYARVCADAWRDFGLQPGTQLRRVKTGDIELRAGGPPALVSVSTRPLQRGRSYHLGGRTYTLSEVKAAQWPAVAADIGRPPFWHHTAGSAARQDQPARKPFLWLRRLADQAGQPALYTALAHISFSAGGYVQFPGQRWLRFPVRGTDPSNAIMTAVDQAGRKVARYRVASRRLGTAKRQEIEITVHPDQQLTDELLLTLAHTAHWVSTFFEIPGGGG